MLRKGFCLCCNPRQLMRQLWFFPMLFMATFGVVWAVIYAPWQAEAAPAWVQAVGSIMAVIVAIVVASQQHRKEEARRVDEKAGHELGLSLRLFGFSEEFYRNVVELLANDGDGNDRKVNYVALKAATTYTDKKIAAVLERMMTRLNRNFDDDMDDERRAIIDAYRQNLAGLIFLLQETTDSDYSFEIRERRLEAYRESAIVLRTKALNICIKAQRQKLIAEREL